MTDPLQLRRFAFARLAALRGTFRFDPTSPYFLSPDGTALLIKIAGRRPVHDMASAKATVALIEQASDTLRVQPAFQGLTVRPRGYYSPPRARVSPDIIVSVPSLSSVSARSSPGRSALGVLIYDPAHLLSLVLPSASLRRCPTLNVSPWVASRA